jgi:hypothetical protein
MIREGSIFDYMRLKRFEKCLIFVEKKNFSKNGSGQWAVSRRKFKKNF